MESIALWRSWNTWPVLQSYWIWRFSATLAKKTFVRRFVWECLKVSWTNWVAAPSIFSIPLPNHSLGTRLFSKTVIYSLNTADMCSGSPQANVISLLLLVIATSLSMFSFSWTSQFSNKGNHPTRTMSTDMCANTCVHVYSLLHDSRFSFVLTYRTWFLFPIAVHVNNDRTYTIYWLCMDVWMDVYSTQFVPIRTPKAKTVCPLGQTSVL